MNLTRISEITGGELMHVDSSNTPMVLGLSNDTRKNCDQRLYVAIKGPNFDGHNYIDQALQSGASAALVEMSSTSVVPSVRVNDAVQAMGDIAAAWRNDFDIPVLAITGSAGKTTLKELSGSILSQSKKGVITEGNLNNEIGVPLTLTRFTKGDEFAVIEMGMNHAGEIDYLSKMASPDIAIINNAAAAHLDDLGTIEAVAKAKGEIVAGLKSDGVLIVNEDDQFANLWKTLAHPKRCVSFGLSASADVSAEYEITPSGSNIFVKGCYGDMQVNLPLHGEHNVRNALAVIAATSEMGCSHQDIKCGLEQYVPLQNRGGSFEFAGLKLIDDTYNANPISMKAAIDVVFIQAQQERLSGRQVFIHLVLGDMGELGSQQSSLHRDVGKAAIGIVQHLYCYGNHSGDYLKGFHADGEINEGYGFDSIELLIEHLSKNISLRNEKELNIVLVKGSRFTGMERVVNALIQKEKQKEQKTEDRNK